MASAFAVSIFIDGSRSLVGLTHLGGPVPVALDRLDSGCCSQGNRSIHALSFFRKEIGPHPHQEGQRLQGTELLLGARVRAVEIHRHLLRDGLLFPAAVVDRHQSVFFLRTGRSVGWDST